ncbi:sulfatase family protein [Phenylobacterium sp.]|uniref:sulfatase family protein n=1 Tax=Phenylobacterium sp. TaxID=1871053 RepID=UPI002DEBDAB6|nr:sulfatase-like hydrolase/transferase [Phenylobacterium sp.]
MAGAGAAVLAAGSPGPGQAAGGRRLSILFILADDLGFADLGCYGRRGLATPNIDRLAAQGVRLTQAYANSAVCSASRTAIITGRYQDRIAVGLEQPIASDEDGERLRLPEGRPTLPSLFKAAGYHTSLVGKWHLAGGRAGPAKAGYDYFFGFHPGATDYFRRPTEKEAAAADYAGAPLFENDTVIQPKGYLTDLLAAAAIRRIEATPPTESFLVSLHFNAPHWPWEGPGDEAKSAKLKSLRDSDSGNEAVFGAMVEAMDSAVGAVLAALDRLGRAEDTLVVFTSDNGGERFSDTWPLTGMKGELLEGGIRVPGIVRWPAGIKAGRTSGQVLIGMDWMATLLGAAGLRPDPTYPPDGEDLIPVMTGASPPHPRKLFWRYKASEQSAVRSGDWKYLKIAGHEYLFNLAQDERERADRQAAEPAIFHRLRAEYDVWNAQMLPYPVASFSETPKGRLADRY